MLDQLPQLVLVHLSNHLDLDSLNNLRNTSRLLNRLIISLRQAIYPIEYVTITSRDEKLFAKRKNSCKEVSLEDIEDCLYIRKLRISKIDLTESLVLELIRISKMKQWKFWKLSIDNCSIDYDLSKLIKDLKFFTFELGYNNRLDGKLQTNLANYLVASTLLAIEINQPILITSSQMNVLLQNWQSGTTKLRSAHIQSKCPMEESVILENISFKLEWGKYYIKNSKNQQNCVYIMNNFVSLRKM